jgi:putative phage-type endonuclease
MGVSPYKTELQLWEDKVFGKDDVETMAMKFGKDNEPMVRKLVCDKLKKNFEPAVCDSTVYPWMMASYDGLSEGKLTAIEIKIANEEDHETASKNKVPEKYFPQLQHQIVCQDLVLATYCSWHKGDLQLVVVSPDDEYIKSMVEREAAFYERMQNFDAPKPTERDGINLDEVGQFMEEALLLKEDQALFDELEERVKQRRQKLLDMGQGRNVKGGLLRITKVIRKGNIDYSAIPQLQKIDLEPFRKSPSHSWRFSFSS